MGNYELYHHGIKGMKWGVRRTEAQLRKARGNLRTYENYADDYDPKNYTVKLSNKERAKLQGQHDKYRSMAKAEKAKITSLERDLETRKSPWSDDAKQASELRKKNVNQMSNAELRKLNERTQLERTYSQLNPSKVQKGMKFVAGAAVTTTTIITLYNNSNKLIDIGKKAKDKMLNR